MGIHSDVPGILIGGGVGPATLATFWRHLSVLTVMVSDLSEMSWIAPSLLRMVMVFVGGCSIPVRPATPSLWGIVPVWTSSPEKQQIFVLGLVHGWVSDGTTEREQAWDSLNLTVPPNAPNHTRQDVLETCQVLLYWGRDA